MAKSKSKTQKMRDFMASHPNASTAEIMVKFNVPKNYVYVVRSQMKKQLSVSAPSEAQVKPKEINIDAVHKTRKFVTPIITMDMVNNPPHYTDGGVDTIAFIEAKGLGYHLGNVVKYVSRAGKKGTNAGLEDLRKARWYLDRAIEKNEFSNPTR
jgi:Protein of unknwon function (DUF3310)